MILSAHAAQMVNYVFFTKRLKSKFCLYTIPLKLKSLTTYKLNTELANLVLFCLTESLEVLNDKNKQI